MSDGFSSALEFAALEFQWDSGGHGVHLRVGQPRLECLSEPVLSLRLAMHENDVPRRGALKISRYGIAIAMRAETEGIHFATQHL